MFVRSTLSILIALLSIPALAQVAGGSSLEARRAQFKQLLAEQWEYTMRQSPEFATMLGDYRYNDRWSDSSLAHTRQQRKDDEQWISRFESIDTSGFPEQEILSKQLMLRNLREDVEQIDLKLYEMPIDQFNGAHLQLAQFVTLVPFDSTKHYEDYIARLHKVPHEVIDTVIEVLRQGERDHMMPPRYVLEKTVEQCRSIAKPAGEANTFGMPAAHFPDSVPEADRKRLHDEIIAAVDNEVRPAYPKLADFLEKDYAPKGRTDPGVWALPNGDALYRFDIRQLTTTDMDPETIHQIGLKEVARIEGEQLAIAKKLGFSDLQSFRESLKSNPKVFATSRDQILSLYRSYIAGMQPELPKLFGLLPRTQLEVKPVEEYREKDAASASYVPGTPDGKRAAIVYVNTGDFQHRQVLDIESTAYHEGVPGHHMQIAIAQQLPELPPFRQHGFFSAYQEGWALYAESLGKEIGKYQDPYSDYGHLSDELLRAIRLVVDTGVHYKHWTRQQMVDYFHEHSTEDEPSVQAETDRYIVWPAQALGYKLGQLEILKLRRKAKTELGSNFDIKAFHDEILNGGAMPLDTLEARVSAWIAAQKAEHSSQKQ